VSMLVSLIMPAWRPRADWLRKAVASALEEDGCELELIVVDDGCEEPVSPLLAEVADPRLRILRIDHAGPYAARNAGIAAARGTLVRFVDSDDVVEPGSTGRLAALAGGEGERLAYGATLMCDEDLAPTRTVSSELEGDVTATCVLGGFEVFLTAIVFPRTVIERAGRWEETAFAVSGDWDFVLRAVEQAPVRRLDEVVARYRRHSSSITKSADVAAGARAGRLVLDRYFARHPEQRGSSLERRAYSRLHLDRARAHASLGERRPAARQLALAARRDPAAALAAAGSLGAARLRPLIARASRRGSRAPRERA
jgi:glycosyltransferase involved in cell wall biosynthesis